MKVLFFARLFHPHIGGVEKHVYELSKRLIQKGYEVIVITEKFENNLKDSEEFEKIKIHRIPVKNNFFKKFYIWFWLFKNKKLIKEADVVHTHDVFFWFLPLKLFYPLKKVYATFHGYESFPIKKKAIVVRKISEKLSLGNICVGDFIKKWYGTKPDFVIYGGVNLLKSKTYNLKPKKNSAVFIGRLDDQTGILTYLNAYKELKKEFKDFEFTVLGDGEYKDRIKKDAKVLGFKKEIFNYLENNHYAFVSRYLSILEAFSAKRPVFAVYDNPIKKDYLEMTPFSKFIKVAKNKEDLISQIKNMNKKDEEKNVEGAYNWVKSQTWDNVLSIYLKLWGK